MSGVSNHALSFTLWFVIMHPISSAVTIRSKICGGAKLVKDATKKNSFFSDGI
jgi:hypothetical protein